MSMQSTRHGFNSSKVPSIFNRNNDNFYPFMLWMNNNNNNIHLDTHKIKNNQMNIKVEIIESSMTVKITWHILHL